MLVKPLIVLGNLLDANLSAHNEARLRFSAGNELDKMGSQELRINGIALETQSLGEEIRDGELDGWRQRASSRRSSRVVGRSKDSDLAQTAIHRGHGDHVLDDHVLLDLELVVYRFEAHAVHASHHTMGLVPQDLLHGVGVTEIDGDRSDGCCLFESLRDVVDRVDS